MFNENGITGLMSSLLTEVLVVLHRHADQRGQRVRQFLGQFGRLLVLRPGRNRQRQRADGQRRHPLVFSHDLVSLR
ncbi:MAG: hypothetical protein MUE63_13980 [Xanthomonadales bacterium]|nr:hypothetical protein [Xanthomonadales bacterium]